VRRTAIQFRRRRRPADASGARAKKGSAKGREEGARAGAGAASRGGSYRQLGSEGVVLMDVMKKCRVAMYGNRVACRVAMYGNRVAFPGGRVRAFWRESRGKMKRSETSRRRNGTEFEFVRKKSFDLLKLIVCDISMP
jgi:hypothetical protein